MTKAEFGCESKLGLRLDKILGASASCIAAASGVGLVGPTESAEAAIIHSGPVNISIPDNIDGVYMNLVTGATGAAGGGVAGWDINPYSSSAGNFSLWGATTTTWLFTGDNPTAANANYIQSLNTPVAGTFGRPGGGLNIGTQVTLNANNYFGVQFTNESTGNATNFGWVKIAFGATAGIRTITEYAYENAGAGINVGQITAVPEPSTICLLATGAVGLFAARRRRALANA